MDEFGHMPRKSKNKKSRKVDEQVDEKVKEQVDEKVKEQVDEKVKEQVDENTVPNSETPTKSTADAIDSLAGVNIKEEPEKPKGPPPIFPPNPLHTCFCMEDQITYALLKQLRNMFPKDEDLDEFLTYHAKNPSDRTPSIWAITRLPNGTLKLQKARVR
jgi:archaellum component FlaD/FlaE